MRIRHNEFSALLLTAAIVLAFPVGARALEINITTSPTNNQSDFLLEFELTSAPTNIDEVRIELGYRQSSGSSWITAEKLLKGGPFSGNPTTIPFSIDSWTGLLFPLASGTFDIGLFAEVDVPGGPTQTAQDTSTTLTYTPDTRSHLDAPDCTNLPTCSGGTECLCGIDDMEFKRGWDSTMISHYENPLTCDGTVKRVQFPKPNAGTQFINPPDDGHSSNNMYTETNAVIDELGSTDNIVQKVSHYAFWSDVHQDYVGYSVWLPSSHDGPGDCEGTASSYTKYPVVYFLHGSGGDETKEAEMGSFLEDAQDRGMDDTIYVFPNGGNNTWATLVSCTTSPCTCPNATWADLPGASGWSNGPPMAAKEAFFELLDHIDENFCTYGDRYNRGIEGMSDGGTAAMEFAVQRPDLFASAQPLSGAYTGDLESYHEDPLRCTITADVEAYDGWMASSGCQPVAFRGATGEFDFLLGDNELWEDFLNDCQNGCDSLTLPSLDTDNFGDDPSATEDTYTLLTIDDAVHNWKEFYEDNDLGANAPGKRKGMFDFHQDVFERDNPSPPAGCPAPPTECEPF